MKTKKKRSQEEIKLSNILLKNINWLVRNSGLKQFEIASIAKMPLGTLTTILAGGTINPKIHTLASIARVFNINIASLIGELPLNSLISPIPILHWSDLDVQKKVVNRHIDKTTTFICTNLISESLGFALLIEGDMTELYKKNSIILIEEISKFVHNDLIVISTSHSEPTIKRVIKDGEVILLKSITHDVPIQKYTSSTSHVFGVIRETRI